jgi:hypothetical protein
MQGIGPGLVMGSIPTKTVPYCTIPVRLVSIGVIPELGPSFPGWTVTVPETLTLKNCTYAFKITSSRSSFQVITPAVYCYQYAGSFKQASSALHIVDGTSIQGELQPSTTHCVLAVLTLQVRLLWRTGVTKYSSTDKTPE